MNLHIKHRGCRALFCALALALLPWRAEAILVDWDTLTWTPGTLSNSYDIDPANPGADITITISGDTAKFGGGYPAITSNVTGGLFPAETSLQLLLDFTQNSQAITVTVTFNYWGGVDEVTYDLFDVDLSSTTAKGKTTYQYIDQISAIQGRFWTDPYVGATISGSANNTVAGSGTGQTITGTALTSDSSSAANANIYFGTNALQEMTFSYGNDPATQNNPAEQTIALYDIFYRPRPIPEVHPALGALAICTLAIGYRSLRARQIGMKSEI